MRIRPGRTRPLFMGIVMLLVTVFGLVLDEACRELES